MKNFVRILLWTWLLLVIASLVAYGVFDMRLWVKINGIDEVRQLLLFMLHVLGLIAAPAYEILKEPHAAYDD